MYRKIVSHLKTNTMIINFSEENPFLSKDLTPTVIFALNNEGKIFGFVEEIGKKYFPELFSIGVNETFIKKIIPAKTHGIKSIEGNDLKLFGVKCYALGVGWGGTLSVIAKFIHDLGYKEPVSFIWPKEVYLLDIPNSNARLQRHLHANFVEKKKTYPLFEAGVPVFLFNV